MHLQCICATQHHDKISIYGCSMCQGTCTTSASNIHTCNNINANTYTWQCPNLHAYEMIHNISSANDTKAHDITNACKCVYYPTSNLVAKRFGVSQHNTWALVPQIKCSESVTFCFHSTKNCLTTACKVCGHLTCTGHCAACAVML